eukprot:SAG11_NODE_1353_length_5128_cov_3.658183_4_plen_100_part_00
MVDKLLREKKVWEIPSNKNRELGAQGIANGICAFVGGVPGAQSTTVSVLAINEGGTNRLVSSYQNTSLAEAGYFHPVTSPHGWLTCCLCRRGRWLVCSF